MRNVKLNKKELLDILHQNREKHLADYETAVADFKAAVLKVAQANLKLAKTGSLERIAQIQHIPAAPSSFAGSYARAIRMLELSVDEVIELDELTFNQLVLDEWQWKQGFMAASALYKSL